MTDNKNIDKIFRKKSLTYQKEPPPEIWDAILMGIHPAKKRGLPLFWRIAAGMAIILAFGLSYNYISKTRDLGNQNLSKSELADPLLEESSDKWGLEFIEKENTIVKSEVAESQEKQLATMVQKPDQITESTVQNSLMVSENNQENEELVSPVGNKKTWIGAVSHLPIQIEPQAAHKDKIPERKFIIQASWDDLIALEDFEEAKEKDFLIEALMSPTYNYRDIVSSNQSLSKYYNESESGQISYSGGMKVGFVASNRLSIHTGLVYSRIGYSIGAVTSIALKSSPAFDQIASEIYGAEQPVVIANSIGKINNSTYSSSSISTIARPETADASFDYLTGGALLSPDNGFVTSDLSFSQIFHVMEIPFQLKYKLIDRKMDFNFLSGFSTNILLGNNLFLNEGSSKRSIGEIEAVNHINLSGDMGVGIEYAINKKLQLLFEPQFKYYLNSINKDNLISNRPYTLGFYTGMSYTF